MHRSQAAGLDRHLIYDGAGIKINPCVLFKNPPYCPCQHWQLHLGDISVHLFIAVLAESRLEFARSMGSVNTG